ncbi:hypothetical protein B0H11DRAFT_2093838 [Mycena galericulata]|nr:hypothetical protein B0H11DRAFT_2093838 [Mycena galericulata]
MTDQYVVKLPNPHFRDGDDQTAQDPLQTRSSSSNDSTFAPIVRLRRLDCPPENPSQNNTPSMYRYDDLSWDEEKSIWGYKTDSAAWADVSISSDESLTEGSSSTISTAGTSASYFSSPDRNQAQTTVKYPPPPHREVCRKWLRDRCYLGHRCNYVHQDLDYDFPDPSSAANTRRLPPPPPPPEPDLLITLHDHTRVRLGSGFEIHEVTTSVETPWVVISDIPVRVKPAAINQLLSRFGTVQELKFPGTMTKDVMTVKARFSSSAEALQASTALDGSNTFSTRISARTPVNSRSGMVDIQDSNVRILWEAPSKVAYGGYPNLERAHQAIAAARTPFEDYYVHASIYVGLPSIGAVTVKFANLPPSADEKCMERFGHPEDIMWERPNYLVLSAAVDGIKRLLHGLGTLRELDVLPPPYSHGLVRAYATFSSSSAARTAAANLHGRKPIWTGKTRIFARHVQTLKYHMSLDAYEKDAPLIDALREAAVRHGWGMAIATRRLPTAMVVRLSAEGIKALGWLKSEFEKISQGEILRCDGVAVWDNFFGRFIGADYVRNVTANEPGARVQIDAVRRVLKLFGTLYQRAAVGRILLQKMKDLKAQRVRLIRVPGRVVTPFITTQLKRLCGEFGAENIFVDIWERTITLRGDDALYETAVDAIHRVQQSSLAQLTYRPNIIECPVCFNQVVSPITLPCRHTWCRACLIQYLLAAVESRRFPLKCLGDEAKCTECIPLSTARDMLQPNEFNSVVDAALSSYVHAHAKEFHYCPSPDCLQIYRTGPKGTVVQCPACLLRICPHCHAEAHDGFECADRDGADKLFKEWAARHDVKNCPGCAIPIERDEGCHHVTCIQCQTHICWVCLQTFPKGEGIYKHMRLVHGGIGLGQEY